MTLGSAQKKKRLGASFHLDVWLLISKFVDHDSLFALLSSSSQVQHVDNGDFWKSRLLIPVIDELSLKKQYLLMKHVQSKMQELNCHASIDAIIKNCLYFANYCQAHHKKGISFNLICCATANQVDLSMFLTRIDHNWFVTCSDCNWNTTNPLATKDMSEFYTTQSKVLEILQDLEHDPMLSDDEDELSSLSQIDELQNKYFQLNKLYNNPEIVLIPRGKAFVLKRLHFNVTQMAYCLSTINHILTAETDGEGFLFLESIHDLIINDRNTLAYASLFV